MPWENDKHERTLFILKTKVSGKERFAIYPWTIVQRLDTGEEYMEPLPQDIIAASLQGGLVFNNLKVLDGELGGAITANMGGFRLNRGNYQAMRGPTDPTGMIKG